MSPRLSTQPALTQILASSRSRESLPRILEVLGQGLEAELVELWLVERGAKVLVCEASWHAPGIDGELHARSSSGMTFPRGRGLPGRVWAAGAPEWTSDVVAHAQQLGLKSGVAFPVQLADETTGVLQCFFRGTRERLPDELFADVGGQIALFLERARLGDALVQQARELLEMSTPVLRIWSGVLFAPVVGALDATRARQLEERVLVAVTQTQSPVLLLDVTGIPVLDTFSAQHLMQTVRAVGLLGAKVVVSGVSPQIAMTLANLGIALDGVDTVGTLADGLRLALALLGVELKSPAS